MEKIEVNEPNKINWYTVVWESIKEPWNSYYSDVYSPWETKEQLRLGREVKWENTVINHTHDWTAGQGGQISYNNLTNLPALYTPKYYQVNDTRWNWWFTAGNFTVTVWFRPKRIDLKAHTAFPNDWMSVGTAIVDVNGNIVNWCIFLDASYTWVFDTSASSIWIIKSSSSSTAITVTAISDTWFTVNVNNNTWSFNATFTVEW